MWPKKKKKWTGCECWCPICGLGLNESASALPPNQWNRSSLVNFRCKRCKCLSAWDFDLLPVPHLVKYEHMEVGMRDAK